ncbi:UNVERIFIED_CONTAM: hypothetical protein K2H54_054652 [Gekko kuhli]
MRPGYSAKRYLLKLLRFAQIWDPNILQKLQRAGCIKDSFVLEENVPYHRRKQDLSAIPPKYKRLPVFCSPGSCLWDQMEKVKPGLGLSSYMKSVNEPWLVEGYKRGKHARRKSQIPSWISIRKLSFHLSPQRSKEGTWRQKAKYGGTAEHPNVGVHQNRGLAKEARGPIEMPNQSTDCPALEKILPDTSELWSEESRVTFYGGFFQGRKLSDSVKQRHPKNPSDRDGGPLGFLPLIQPGTSLEQSGVRKPQRKPMPEIFRLPAISEEHLRAHRGKLKSRELPKELTIFPLLVRLEREPHTKRKNPRARGSEASVCNKLLAPLSSDHFPEPEHGGKMRQVVSGEILETPQQSIQDDAPASGPLPAIARKKDPSDQDKRPNSETATSGDPDINGVCKDLLVGITNSALQEKLEVALRSAVSPRVLMEKLFVRCLWDPPKPLEIQNTLNLFRQKKVSSSDDAAHVSSETVANICLARLLVE